jgi:hypothetical protein
LTIRKQWLIVLTLTAVLAVFINSIILGSLINRYFLSYNAENYTYHVGQIEQLAANTLKNGSYSQQLLSIQLESTWMIQLPASNYTMPTGSSSQARRTKVIPPMAE